MPLPGLGAEIAKRAEAVGFDLCLFTDTQRLAGDPFAEACLAAKATSVIRLGTGVTNPVTRAATVIASAIGTLQVESSGRAVLGISRGDSAAADAGRHPASVAELTASVRELRARLAGGLTWLAASGLPPVPIDVACSGPRAIAAAAAVADRVTFAVGASADRVRWAFDSAVAAADASGRPAGSIRYGAYLNVVLDDEPERARDLARSGVGVLAHFSAMTPQPSMVPAAHVELFHQLSGHYEMDRHTQSDSFQGRAASDEFIDWFAIAGDAEYCAERLAELIRIGLDHIYVIGGAETQSPLDVLEGEARLAREVLTHLDARTSARRAVTHTHLKEET